MGVIQFSITRWVVSTFVGWLLGIAFILLLSGLFDSVGIEDMQFYLGIGMGAGVGFMQWRLLRKVHLIDLRWIWFSVVGLGTPFLVFDLVRYLTGKSLGSYYLPISIMLAGLLVGLFQFKILSKLVFKAKYWILMSFLGWALAALTIAGIDFLKGLSNNNWVMFSVNLFLILAGGIILGITTGPSMAKILKYAESGS